LTYQVSNRDTVELICKARATAQHSVTKTFQVRSDNHAADIEAVAQASKGASALLSRVLARTGLDQIPIIQLLPCAPGESATKIALGLSVMAAGTLGRSLLIDATKPETNRPRQSPSQSDEEAPLLPTMRDVYVPALHHARLPNGLHDRRRNGQKMNAILAATSQPFRLLAIDCLPSQDCLDSLAISSHCTCTILVIQAGVTRLSDVMAATRDVAAANGNVLGTVLTHVPNSLPKWIRNEGGIWL
jgi:Mrp family chromosome partitioning ATPase